MRFVFLLNYECVVAIGFFFNCIMLQACNGTSFIHLFFSWAQIIERSLPKKPKVKKDPSVIEREEMEKIGKVWVNIVKRDIPKHHRIFTTFHRKQIIDAKRFSESCQREACICYIAYVVLCVLLFISAL